ncbi:MAG: dTDP-4-amino-4,6-dideoxygalactose transaminase [Chthoniobacterales bacterium]
MNIHFNKPLLLPRSLDHIREAFTLEHTSGNGPFTAKCHAFLKQRYGFSSCLLTQSCTAALEMAALLADIAPGDEVIVPSFTFVSTANAFALRNAHIRFVDSTAWHPNMDCSLIEELITPRTKAVVCVHYAGMACDMQALQDICRRHNLCLIEDAAQSIDTTYQGRALGTFGNLSAFSFHESKNIICGEGGCLAINDPLLHARADILWEKGTNRSAFLRGEVDKYSWVDVGSSFLPSEITAAFLYGQLESLENIQARRVKNWNRYHAALSPLAEKGYLEVPRIPEGSSNNAHMYYVVCRSGDERTRLMAHLKSHGIQSVFHYQALHASSYYASRHGDRKLPQAERYTECLLRLPLHYHLTDEEVDEVVERLHGFYA